MTDQTPANVVPFDGFKPIDGNFTQVPNQVFELMPTLSGSELKCLLYIVRHTLGFHEPTKTITLDEFEHGRKTKKRARMDGGVGLGRETIANALKSLAERAIITRETDASDKARQRITYGLNRSENPTSVNQSENPTSEVGKSDRSGQLIRPRSVKETKDKKQKKEAPAKAARPRVPHFDAIVEAFKFDEKYLTTSEKKMIGTAASELKAAGYEPSDVPHIYAYCVQQGFDGFTPMALPKHAGKWRAARPEPKPTPLHIDRPAEDEPFERITPERKRAMQAEIDQRMAEIAAAKANLPIRVAFNQTKKVSA